jgi:AraC family transcriptional regulator of adaptative response / DNA-3-methyladenine glycosylase II
VASIGVPAKRAQAIRAVSRAIADRHVVLTPGSAPESTRDALLAIPGIGRWTADYIAMRALREPDAFPSGDLVLRRVASRTRVALRERELSALAENWRPWRAYAVIALWNSAG